VPPWVRARMEAGNGCAPNCPACGGFIKTATVSFEQAMPDAAMRRAQDLTLSCDLFLAIGSSLVVWPAAGFPCKIGNVVELGRLTVEDDQTGAVLLGHQIVRHPPMFTGCELLAACCPFCAFPPDGECYPNGLWANLCKGLWSMVWIIVDRLLRRIRPRVQN
jgi:Sir2 family